MSSATELTAKWSARLVEWRALRVRVDGDKVAVEVLDDLRELVNDDLVTLAEANLISGYSLDHLQRLVAAGTIANMGRKHAPRVRRSDVPTKPGAPRTQLQPALAREHPSLRQRIVADAQARQGA